jgi:UDP-N-acetyl-D-galactosamine dehydrogenase
MRNGIQGKPRINVLGVTFKENVPDHRNTRVVDIVRELRAFGLQPQVHDPLAEADQIEKEYGITLSALDELQPADGVILAVPHTVYRHGGWPLLTGLLKNGKGLVVDVRACLPRDTLPPAVELWRI